MGFSKTYFDEEAGSPPLLTAEATRRIRFEEIDPLGMVWHGRYPSFLEDGRIAFGDRFGLGYMEFKNSRIAAPVVQMHLDYLASLRFDEMITISATLHWTESMRLNFSYSIRCGKRLAAQGYTVQLFTDMDGNMLFVAPKFVETFRRQWQAGAL